MSDRARVALRLALVAWLLLAGSIAWWPFADAGIGRVTALVAGLPLLLPLPGLLRGSRRALRAAPMALAPALALAITEIMVNPAARVTAGISLALVLAAFAGIVAALRTAPQG
jgi:uncharacterized membrane protein